MNKSTGEVFNEEEYEESIKGKLKANHLKT
jgi:hypothetical protein